MCAQGRYRLVSLFRFWLGKPNASPHRRIAGTDQIFDIVTFRDNAPLAVEFVPFDRGNLFKIAHTMLQRNWALRRPILPFRPVAPPNAARLVPFLSMLPVHYSL